MVLRFEPRVEQLEAREVPAVTWTWNPAGVSADGSAPANWTNDAALVNQIPDDANDNVIFVGAANKPCSLVAGQSALGKITVANTYTSTIYLSGTTFTESSILGACTLDLNFSGVSFGNGTLGDPANSVQVKIEGGGSVIVKNLKTTVLADVLLSSSVNVDAGGTLRFRNVRFNDIAVHSTFTVGGEAISDAAGANYFGYQSNGTYYNPINVVAGGHLKFQSRSTIASYITCAGTMTVQGTQASPNVLVDIIGRPSPDDRTGLIVPGVLNLAMGSTIGGAEVKVSGGMNLVGPPAGSAATVGTVDATLRFEGTATARAVLNLNTGTLSLNGSSLFFDNCSVTTHLNYDAGTLGNIAGGGPVFFQGLTTLTQGASGTPRAITLPLITGTLEGDFGYYVLLAGVKEAVSLNAITLKKVERPGGLDEETFFP